MIKESPRSDNYSIPEVRAKNYGWRGINPDRALSYMLDFSDLFGVIGLEPEISYGFCNTGLTQIYSLLISEEFPKMDANYEIEVRFTEEGFKVIINDAEEFGAYSDFNGVLGRLQEWLD